MAPFGTVTVIDVYHDSPQIGIRWNGSHVFDMFPSMIVADKHMITSTWNKYWSSRHLKGTDELSQSLDSLDL